MQFSYFSCDMFRFLIVGRADHPRLGGPSRRSDAENREVGRVSGRRELAEHCGGQEGIWRDRRDYSSSVPSAHRAGRGLVHGKNTGYALLAAVRFRFWFRKGRRDFCVVIRVSYRWPAPVNKRKLAFGVRNEWKNQGTDSSAGLTMAVIPSFGLNRSEAGKLLARQMPLFAEPSLIVALAPTGIPVAFTMARERGAVLYAVFSDLKSAAVIWPNPRGCYRYRDHLGGQRTVTTEAVDSNPYLPAINANGELVILVDDCLRIGPMRSAIAAANDQGAKSVLVAVPFGKQSDIEACALHVELPPYVLQITSAADDDLYTDRAVESMVEAWSFLVVFDGRGAGTRWCRQ
jgi:hypothetical protein